MTDVEYRSWPICTTSFKDGLRCMDCNRVIHLGQPYGRAFGGFTSSGETVLELKCVYCADGNISSIPLSKKEEI